MNLETVFSIGVRINPLATMSPVIVGADFYQAIGFNILTDAIPLSTTRIIALSWIKNNRHTKVTDELYRVEISAREIKQLLISTYLKEGRQDLAKRLQVQFNLEKDVNHLRRCFQLPVAKR